MTTTADTIGGNTASVPTLIANPGPDGRISLREAILATNATIGLNTIRFGIPPTDANHLYYQDDGMPGSLMNVQATPLADLSTPSSPVITNYDADYPIGQARSWYRIQLGSALPAITSAVSIDSTTQPFSIPGAGPVVEIDGMAHVRHAGPADRQLGEHDPRIRHQPRRRQRHPHPGVLEQRHRRELPGHEPGRHGRGPGNVFGVVICGITAPTDNNRIGGTAAADRNVISANSVDGIQINDGAGGPRSRTTSSRATTSART